MKKNFICMIILTGLLYLPMNIVYAQYSKAEAKKEFLKTNPQLNTNDLQDIVLKDSHTSKKSKITHQYYQQRYAGIEIFGATASLHTVTAGDFIKVNNNFISQLKSKTTLSRPSIDAIDAIKLFANHLNLSTSNNLEIKSQEDNNNQKTVLTGGNISQRDIPARLVYHVGENGNLILAWDIAVEGFDNNSLWSVRIDAQSGSILEQHNLLLNCKFHDDHEEEHSCKHQEEIPSFLAANSEPDYKTSMVGGYRVFDLPIENPVDGARTLENDPDDPVASPFGWHDTDGVAGSEYTITRGNNIYAFDNGDNAGYSPDGGTNLVFDYPLDITGDPNVYEDAAITNAFYWGNKIHDILYQYGFDEASGNFQKNNYGNGGIGGDALDMRVQEVIGCNGQFGPSIDGGNSYIRFFVCNGRDGAYNNTTTTHEYVHGLSHRLTGGASTISCLSNQEQMGEGWSDYFGITLTIAATDTETDSRAYGDWFYGNPNGIRPYPYNTDMAVNPLTYDDIITLGTPHPLGSVWATMLWEMNWGLINQYGFDTDLTDGSGGNNIGMHLVTEGMKLQPCSPGFVDGRDAILAADVALYGGANQCIIWEAFAKRGLGFSANQGASTSKTDGSEAFDLPTSCGGPCIQQYANVPYSTSFESGLDQYWCTASENEFGRIQVTNANGPHSGSQHLTMDVTTNNNYCTNEAALGLQLLGYTDAELTFWHKEFGDESNAEDGVFFSDDGGNSYSLVYSLQSGSSAWTEIVLDIDSLAVSNGLFLTNNFMVKFQQRDNYKISTDGFAFDDVSVTGTALCSVDVFPSSVSAVSNNGTYSVGVVSSNSWTVTDNATWMTVSPTSGTGNGVITITVSENTTTHTRSGLVTISMPCGSPTATVSVSQEGIPDECATRQYANMPYSTSFESGLDQYWCTASENEFGRIQVTSANGPHSGSQHLTMDVTTNNNYCTNEATLGLQLAGYTDAELTFWHKEFGDESDAEDGVFFSDDGGNSYSLVYSLQSGSSAWTEIVLDIDSLAASNGLNLTHNFVVKFQQRDNYKISTDGFAFDDVSVTGTGVCSVDVFPSTVSAGSNNGTYSVGVVSNSSWSVTDNTTWMTISPTNGTGNEAITITVSENTSANTRSGLITISCGNSTTTVSVSQAGTSTGCSAQQYANMPYSTGFESGLDQYWCTASENEFGRIQVTSANGPHSGSQHLTMDVTTNNNYCTNEATLGLQLAGFTDTELTFWHKEFSDESNAEDGVFFSDDGGNSYSLVYSLQSGSSAWTEIVLDVDSLAASNGLNLTDNFVVKFQQRDNYKITTDGFAFDDVSVTGIGACTLSHTTDKTIENNVIGGGFLIFASLDYWTATESIPWLTFTNTSGNNGNYLLFSVDNNTTQSPRVGVLTISCGTSTSTITVTQLGDEGEAPLTESPSNDLGDFVTYNNKNVLLLSLSNAPNPFNANTTIKYSIGEDANISLLITDITGRVIARPVVNEFKNKGTHSVVYQADNLSSGIYFYSLITNSQKITKRMVVTK